jgi:hypothetical protein
MTTDSLTVDPLLYRGEYFNYVVRPTLHVKQEAFP